MDLQAKYKNLCDWLHQNDSWVNPKMGIRNEGSNGNGMFALQSITGENLFNISSRCHLNPKNSGLELNPNKFDYRHSTVIALIYESHKTNSFWRPYLEILPSLDSFTNHPLYQTLRGDFPRVSELVNFYVDNQLNDFKNFVVNFREWSNSNQILQQVQDSEILHCYLLCISRMWTSVGMIPIADLLQHKNTSNISLIVENGNSVMTAQQEIRNGEAIFDNYLLQDDIMLFINFGFVENSELITIPLNFHFEEQNTILKKLIDQNLSGKLFLTSEGVNVNLMKHLRLNLLSLDDLKFIDNWSETTGETLINFNNEFKALQRLKFRVSNIIPQNDLVLLNNHNYATENVNSQNISLLLSRIFKIRESTFNFIKKYWADLIN